MRPVRLEMEGFGAFRDAVAIDFTDADLFALTGPTGSGKTTVIDGICFALFGSVPRYDDRRLVAPAISQGRNEARVRLDFTVDGAAYNAVRVVRRTPKGATTKEARLERGDTGVVLAGNEKEVSAEAERILGLTFDHFTTCVVLPQGEFARFLHEKPEQRQGLLVKLLDLGVYERMAAKARERASSAKLDAEHVARRIDDLSGATPEAKAAADARVRELAGLRDEIDGRLPVLAALIEQLAAVRAEAEEAASWVARLAATVVPEGVDVFGDRLAAATADATAAREATVATDQAVDTAEAALAALPSRADLERSRQQHADRQLLLERRATGSEMLAAAGAAVDEAAGALATAEHAGADAVAAVEALRATHRAHAVIGDLVVGEPCPVCQQDVVALPNVPPPADLSDAMAQAETARSAIEQARHQLSEATNRRTKCETTLEHIEVSLAAIGDLPPLDAIDEQLNRVAAAERELAEARLRCKSARSRRDDVDRVLVELQQEERGQRAASDEARDAVAALGPPARGSDGLAADWAALAAWAVVETAAQRARAEAASARAVTLESERTAALKALAERCEACGVEADGGSPRDAVVEALARAEGVAAKLADELREIEKLQAEATELGAIRDLHAAMARLLGSTGFEKWLLDEALDRLAIGASELLRDLSAGQYSLGLDERRSGFVVVDHRNADETRLARTLSGGETFLASLALALALADQLSLLAARGGARLEAIFLDEGFGTLDPATLDTVASAIEELGSRGRMVGLISHVAELAERVPVRFEVTKGPHTATVERVDR